MFPQRGQQSQEANSYGSEGDQKLQWAGDASSPGVQAVEISNTNQPSGNTGEADPNNATAKDMLNEDNSNTGSTDNETNLPPAVIDYDDGFGPLPENPESDTSGAAISEGLALIQPDYNPSDPIQALQFMKEWMTRHTRWRAGVSETTISPHSAICQFEISRPSGTYIGTGFYISSNRILTCAHNVIGWDEGKEEATYITVTPGLNGTSKPFGSFRVYHADWEYHPRYDGTYDYDLAVLRVNTPPPNGYYFERLEALDVSIEDSIIVCGYGAETGDEKKQNMEGDTIRALSDNMERFQYNINTEGGNSGSPVYYVDGYQDEVLQQSFLEVSVIGVHISAFDDRLNQGCRFTQDKIDWIWRAGESTSSAQELTQSMSVNPYAAEVKYRMFIPSPVIKGPPMMNDFGGDGRGFSYSSGSSRGEISAMVHLTQGIGIDRIDSLNRYWGESTSYDSDDTYHVSGKPDWWLNKRSGTHPIERSTLAVTNDNLNIIPGLSGRAAVQAYLEHASAVTISAAGALPLMSVAPDIDADVSVLFRNHNGLIQAKAVGRHDGFPAHELYVNGISIYRYDPVAAGNGPESLVGYGDIDVNSDWKTVARTYTVRTGGQALELNESFTLNWDEVQSIAQPTNVSCWAAAGAMVVGWRDRMSLSPETIAEISGRTTATGLDPAQVGSFATDLGLEAAPPQSYTEEGFKELLENKGPLWVGAAVPSLHAIVVTGLYNDGKQLYVRVTDPWDRTVGSPGSPGAYANTHMTGSRYILKWEDFVAEYESAAINNNRVNLQILHAKSTQGRQPNRGETTPPGYAQNFSQNSPQELLPNISFSDVVTNLTPPTIQLIETPSGSEGTITESWNSIATKHFGVDIANKLTPLPTLAHQQGWTIATSLSKQQELEINHSIGSGLGIGSERHLFQYFSSSQQTTNETQKAATVDQSTILITVISGAPDDFVAWSRMKPFTSINPSIPAGVLLLDNLDLPIGVAFLLSLTSATQLDSQIPSIVDAVQTAHATTITPPVSTPGSQPTAQQLSQNIALTPVEPEKNGLNEPSAANNIFPPANVKIFRSRQENNGINYDLFLMDGSATPQTPPQITQDLIPGEQILLTEWPYIEGQNGRTQGGVAIDWSHGSGTVANVRVTPIGGQVNDGWQVSVRADIDNEPSTRRETKLKVSIRTTFTRNGHTNQTGISEVVLSGSGQYQTTHREEQSAPHPQTAVA